MFHDEIISRVWRKLSFHVVNQFDIGELGDLRLTGGPLDREYSPSAWEELHGFPLESYSPNSDGVANLNRERVQCSDRGPLRILAIVVAE